MGHRMVWSFLAILVLLTFRRDWQWLKQVRDQPSLLLWFLLISIIICCNWFAYTWAVTQGFVVEASLGYFMNPLVNVLLGVTFLSERPRTAQFIAILLAFCGVSYLTFVHGSLPWVSLVLAFSFGFYGLLKKSVSIGPIRGFGLETAFMFIPGVFFLWYFESTGEGVLGHLSLSTDLLLIAAGAVTAMPLVLFAAAAKHLTLTSLGVFQYIAPSLQFVIGVFLFQESFSTDKLVGFIFVWVALLIFTVESLLHRRKHLKAVPIIE
jgi:chloramphenicol-sensitive protein RarD